jgi:TonB family protein
MVASLMLLAMAGAAPLLPIGPWVANFDADACHLTRKFGPQGDVAVSFWPYPLGDALEITVITPEGHGQQASMQTASLEVQPAGAKLTADYSGFRAPKAGKFVRSFLTKRILLDALDDSQALIFTFGGDRIEVLPKGVTKGLHVLKDCQAGLLKDWGVDLKQLATVVTPAKRNEGHQHWISTYDYPEIAVQSRLGGIVKIIWSVQPDGRATDCKVVSSSKIPMLDKAACDAITRRARYQPALNATGQPTMTYDMRRVIWIVPQ